MLFSFPQLPPVQTGKISGFDSEVVHLMDKFRVRRREYRLLYDSGEAQYHLFLGSSGIFPTPDLLAREIGHGLSCSAGLLVCQSSVDKYLVMSWEPGMSGFVVWVHFREQLLSEPGDKALPSLEPKELDLLRALERWELESEQYRDPSISLALQSLQERGLAECWECWNITSRGRKRLEGREEDEEQLNLPLTKLLQRLSSQGLAPSHLSVQESLRIHGLQDLGLVEKEVFWHPTPEGRELLWDEEE